jgi:hypothetical protein
MRRIVYILALAFLYLILTAKSCDNRQDNDDAGGQPALAATIDSIRAGFTPDTLTESSLRTFEARAKTRLSDFSDYLAIYSDTSVPKTFRSKASEMIRRLFISGNALLEIRYLGDPKPGKIIVSQFLDIAKSEPAPFLTIIPDSTRVIKSLHREGGPAYKGRLGFSCFYSGQTGSRMRPQAPARGTVEFVVAKQEKIFGTDTLMIWDLFLGNME